MGTSGRFGLMESIVTRVLSKYFKKFIKDFKSDQFTVSLLKGRAQLSDLELNGSFIQEMLMIPPNMEIRYCSCNELTVTLPNVTKLSDKPVTLKMDKVCLNLEEPAELSPIRKTVESPSGKNHKKSSSVSKLSESPKRKKKKSLHSVVRDMRFMINEAHFIIKLQPRNDAGPEPWSPTLEIVLYDIVIQTTNDKWEVVDLSQSRIKNADKTIENSYKMALCRSLSVSLVSDDQSSLPIITKLPVEIHITTTTSLTSGAFLGVDIHCILDEIHLSWNLLSWNLIVKLFSSLRQCLDREMPPEIQIEAKLMKKRKKQVDKALANLDVTYRILIRTWSMSFLKAIDQAEDKNGYIFKGSTLNFSILPKKRILVGEEPQYQSNVNMTMKSLVFGEIIQNAEVDANVANVISQLEQVDNKDTPFVDVSIQHRWAKVNAPKSTNLNIQVHGLKVVLDREILKGFYKFLSGSVIEVVKGDLAKAKEKKSQKKEQKNLQKLDELVTKLKPTTLSDYFYWFHNSSVTIEINNTIIIVPRDYYVRPDGVQLNHELTVSASKLALSNAIDGNQWQSVPYLEKALKSLPSNFLESILSPKVSNKFQIDISDVKIESSFRGQQYSPILQPTSMRIYGRMPAKNEKEPLLPNLELTVHAGVFHLSITEQQEIYFKEMIPLYKRWYHKVDKEYKGVSDATKAELKEQLEESKEVAIRVASKLAENTKAKQIIEKAKVDKLQAVEEAFKSFQCVILFKADTGTLEIPLQNIERSYASLSADQGVSSTLSTFKFNALDFVVENSLNHQLINIQLGNFEARDLDHPKSPSSLSLVPLSAAADYLEEAYRHLIISIERASAVNNKSHTDILVRLQGMQAISKVKPGAVKGLHQNFEAALPDLKRVAKKITSSLVSLKDNKEKMQQLNSKVKERLKEGVDIAEKTLDYLDLAWRFQIADCEFALYESHTNKPFGSIKVANFNDTVVSDRFETLQAELITTKMKLAESDMNLNEAVVLKREMHEKMEILQKSLDEKSAKAKKELELVEQQLIETKMALVEAQVEMEELRRKVRGK